MVFTNEYIEEISKLTDKDIYLVGGSVRDYFIKKDISDFDIVVEGDAANISESFASLRRIMVIPLDKNNKIFRVVLNIDGKKTTFNFCSMKGKDIHQDLSKRDFTMNALAVKIEDGKIDFEHVIDPYNGVQDIKNSIIREVSGKVFEDNPIRILRAVRFMSQLNFDISNEICDLIKNNSKRIKEIPGEKLSNEIFKILEFKRAYYYFNFMDKHLDILGEIFPEIQPMKEVGRCKYHVVDAWTHSLHTMRVVEKIIYSDGYFKKHLKNAYEKHTSQIIANGHTKMQLMKLAALFHDIGKPKARWVDEAGRVRFRGHEIVGAEIMADISDRLYLSKKEKKYLCKIVKEHMWPLILYKTNDVSGRALYGLFKNFGESTLEIILIGLADIISTRQLLKPHEEMGMYKIHAEYLANNYLTRFKELQNISHIINGDDILKEFNIKDEYIIGDIINSVKKAVFFGEIPLEKDRIIEYIKEQM
ncbi:CCA tRNA nucleotidyltransferase [Wukongibacter sp. M2B1]|uniref:CCA tRNA nucleotidyltransferase n=1 Tax=Wukongibacter sp. M2B1 TaxID=3088895 RepID=UPI003D7B10EE